MVDHLLDEVDADLRADRMHQLWLRHRTTLLIVIVAVIIGTGAASIWKSYQEKRGGELLLQLTNAQSLYDQGKFTDAATAFDKTAHAASGDTRTIAQLWQGRALAKAGKKPEAVAILKEASEPRNIWGDLACLRLASLDESAASACLSDAHDSPLSGQRRQWGAASDWHAGKKAQAIATLEELETSNETTEANRAQIGQWLATLRSDGAPPPVEEKSANEKAAEEKTDEKPADENKSE